MTIGNKVSKKKVMLLIKEINRSKEDVIEYLNSIGVEKVTLNTTLDPDIVNKVYNHFKRDLEEQEKHKKKVLDFSLKNRIEISEAEEQKRKQEEAKRKKEEEDRIKKVLEEKTKAEEEEKKKQELLAILERENMLKEQEQKEKEAKEKLEKILDEKKQKEQKKKLEEEAKKKAAEEKKTKDEKHEQAEEKVKAKEVVPEEKAVAETKEIKADIVGAKATVTETEFPAEKISKPEQEKKSVEIKKTEPTPATKEIPAKAKESPKTEVHKDQSGAHKREEFHREIVSPFNKPIKPLTAAEKQKADESRAHHAKDKDFRKHHKKEHGERKERHHTDRQSEGKPASTEKKPNEVKHGQHKPPFDKRRKERPPHSGRPKFEQYTLADAKKDKSLKKASEVAGTGKSRIHPAADASTKSHGFDKDKKEKKTKADFDFEKKKKSKLAKTKVKEFSQQEIDEAIRETFQKIDEESSSSARSLARKRKKKERLEQEKIIHEIKEARKNIIHVTEYVTTIELANEMDVEPNEIIKKCFELGMMITINQRLDKDLIEIIASEFGYKVEFQKEYLEDLLTDTEDPPEKLIPRPPVVTVMGHVDHGKTSLLDYIRKANVVAGEAGGITQHIGAYKVKIDNGKEITFLDTPGHEAFTAMRARGGQAADIVVLVVAADDNVMPQTVEAINHALAANAPIIIAINKVDKPDANPDRIRQQLADKNILVEEWGGKYQSVEISAKFGKNIDVLLEKILLEAEMLDLKANPDRLARGVVLEAKLDKGRGITATILVQKGSLKVGDVFIAGTYAGKVKAMFDERDNRIEVCPPSTPVMILGFDGMPQAGDAFIVMENESDAKDIANKRLQLKREQGFRQVRFTTLDDISKSIKEGKSVDLNLIIKTDTDGSAEAISDSLMKLSNNEVKVNVIHKASGQITESDVTLAEASNAIIIGFNVRPNLNARKAAEKSKVDIRLHNVIYKIIDEVKQALEGMLEPEISEEVTATVEIREIFKVPKVGNIAGCYVQDGKISRNNKIRLLRNGLVIYEGSIASLKRMKDDVREVEAGYECGIGLENFNDIKIGDIIEGYKLIEKKKKLVYD